MSEGTAPGAEWSVLSELNPVFCERVSKVFLHVGNFCLAATTVEDVHEMVNEVMSDALKAEDRHALAEAVYRWCLRHQGIVGRTVRELGDRVRRGPYIMRAPGPSAAEVYEGLLAADPTLGLAALERKLKLRKAGAGARVEAEDACRRRWGLRLASVIKEAGLPASERIGALPDSESAWLRAFGSRRGKTLKNRARTWEPVRSWMLQATGKPWPGTTSLLLQYFDERHQCKPMGKTVPQSILSSLCLLELVGQVPPSERLSSDPLLVETVKAWTMQLETVAEPVKQAELVTVAMVLSAEILLVKVGTPAGLRFGCFIFLLMCWGTLRCDDIQGIDPSSITLSQLGMKFTLTRTKTSGPGKRIGQLQGYLLRGLSLSGYDWILHSCRLLQSDEFKFPRDFLCPDLGESWEVSCRDYLDAEGVANLIRRVILELPVPGKKDGIWGLSKSTRLVPKELSLFWSGHSPRHFLPSLAAAIGIEEKKRDFLGRWAAARQGSTAYVLTARQIIQQIQAEVCEALLIGKNPPGYIEEELLLRLKNFAERHGVAGGVAARHNVLVWCALNLSWSLQGEYPAIRVDPGSQQQAVANPVAEASNPDDEEVPPYFVVVGRSGHRRLHMSRSCAVRQERCLETIPLYHINQDSADAICKLCRPRLQEQGAISSESASSDSAEA